MALSSDNIELGKKIKDGINKAVKNLYIESAQRNEKLVTADPEGNVMLVDAKDMLKAFLEKEREEAEKMAR